MYLEALETVSVPGAPWMYLDTRGPKCTLSPWMYLEALGVTRAPGLSRGTRDRQCTYSPLVVSRGTKAPWMYLEALQQLPRGT